MAVAVSDPGAPAGRAGTSTASRRVERAMPTTLRCRLGRLERLEDRTTPAVIRYAGGAYTQDFNALPQATPAGALTGPGPYFLDADAPAGGQNLNFGLTGWQVYRTGNSSTIVFRASDGTLTTGGAYSYGTAADRALGQFYTATTSATVGATFANTGSATYTGFTLTFTAEQWRRGETTGDVQAFGYAVGPAAGAGATTDVKTGAFTAVPAGDLRSVSTAAPLNTAVDGNAAANRSARSVTVTGISWPPGQNLTVRWVDDNSPGGTDDGLAVDDLTFTAAGGGGPPAVTSRNNTAVTEGAAGQTFAVAATGSPTAYALTAAAGQTGPPAGTAIDAAGVITFPTPPAPAGGRTQAFTFTVTATNAAGSGSQPFTLYLLPAARPAAPFAPGNLLVYRLGDGGRTYGTQGSHPTPTAGDTGHPVFLDEYTPAGAFVQTVFVPADGADKLVGGLDATGDGLLTRSADGRLVAITGYRADPGTAGVAGSAVPRVVRTVRPDGTLGPGLTATASGDALRGAATVDGRQFYTAGGATGVRYFDTPGAADAAGVRVTHAADVRGVAVVGGQVYFGTAAGVYRPNGPPLPTGLTGTADADRLVDGSPQQFAVLDLNGNDRLDAGDRLYYADDRAPAGGGGIYRADYAAAGFGPAVQVLAAPVAGLRGLTGVVTSGSSVTLYATAATASIAAATTFRTALYRLTDANAAPAANVALTTLVSRADDGNTAAAPVQQFRGVAVVPTPAGGTATAVAVTPSPASIPVGGTVTFTAAVTSAAGTPGGYITFAEPGTGRALHTTRLDAAGRATFAVTPAVGGSYAVDVFYGGTDTYSGSTGSGTVAITGGTAPTITSGDTLPVRPGAVGQFQVLSTGTPAPTFALSGNPAWVTVDRLTGLLSYAVPAGQAVGGVAFTLTASNGVSPAATQTFTLAVRAAGGFAAGNVVVARAGTGAGPLDGTAAAIYLDEFTPAGVNSLTVALPTSAGGPLTLAGTAAAEGALARSLDGQTLSLAGYRQTPGGSVESAAREVAVVRPDGTADLTTRLPAAVGGVRAAVSADGRGFFLATDGGVRYVPFGDGLVAGPLADGDPVAGVGVAPAGQLYQLTAAGVAAVGAGLPTGGGQLAAVLPGFPATPAGGFAFSPDGRAVYLADARTDGRGGLVKYALANGAWAEAAAYRFPTAGLRGQAVDFSGAAPVVYATTTEATANRLLKFTESAAGFSPPAVLATAPADTAYRGVALAPVVSGPTATTTTLGVAPASGVYGAGVTLAATVARAGGGPAPAGVVSFRAAGGREVGAAVLDAAGVATLVTAGNLGVFGGPHALFAVYTGSPALAGSGSAPVMVSITPAATTTALTVAPSPAEAGASVTLTAAVAVPAGTAPTGTVTVYDGAAVVGTAAVVRAADATFRATLAVTFATAGTHSLTAVYSGDANFTGSSAAAVDLPVTASVVAFTAARYDAVADLQTLRLTVTRTNGTAAVSIRATTAAGTATAGVDYVEIPAAAPVTISFAAGQTTAVVPVRLLDGGPAYSGARAFTVTLADAGGGAVPGTQATATVSLTDPVLRVAGTPAMAGSSVAVAFNRAVDPAAVNLYDPAAGEADVRVEDPTSGALLSTVRGSLVFDPAGTAATFVNTAGSLPTTGSFKLRLRSGPDAFRGRDGRPLDGDADDTPGGNYLSPPLTAAGGPAVGVRGFARAAGQPVNVPADGTGIPITLRGAVTVTQVGFTLTYDPTLLTVPAAGAVALSAEAAAAGLVLGAYTLAPLDDRRAALTVAAAGGSGWTPADGATLLTIAATVPADAPYGAKHLLDIGAVTVNGVAAEGADGVHVAAMPGDVGGDRAYTALDAGLLVRTGVGLATGFAAFATLDPAVVGGVSGGAGAGAADAAVVTRAGLGLAAPQLPAAPGTRPPPAAGPDPRFYLTSTVAGQGQTVTVELRVEVTAAAGVDLLALTSAVTFDPTVLSVSNVRTGAGLAVGSAYLPEPNSGFRTTDHTENDRGRLRVIQSPPNGRATAHLPVGADFAAVAFDVTVNPAAPVGTVARLNLVPLLDNTPTELADEAGRVLTIGPAPSDADTDETVDGAVTVIAPYGEVYIPATRGPAGADVTMPVLYRNGPVPIDLSAFDLALRYDEYDLRFAAAGPGAFVGADPAFTFAANPAPAGTLRVGAAADGRPRTVAPGQVIELAALTFTVLAGGGSTYLNLVPVLDLGTGSPTPTAVYTPAGAVALDPPPTDPPGGPEDGLLSVVLVPNQPPAVAVRDTVNAAPGRVLFNPAAVAGLQTAAPNAFAFTAADAITVADADARGGTLTVTVTVSGDGSMAAPVGSLAAAAVGSATVTPSAGGTVLTVVGRLDDLNRTLAGLRYTPGPGYSGRTAVAVTADDGGNGGYGGPLATTRTTAVDVVGLYLSELMLGPAGTGPLAPSQYVEVVSTAADFRIPDTVYLVGVEGDNDAANNPGVVQDVFRLGGLTTGPNGYLALLQRGQGYTAAGVTDLRGTVRANTGGTAATGPGFGNGPTSVYDGVPNVHTGQQSGTGPRPGAPADELRTDLERAAASYLLVQAAAAPAVGADIDAAGDDDGTPDGAVYAGWNVLDGVGLLGAVGGSAGRSYAPITFGPSPTAGTALPGTPVVVTDAGGSPWTPTYAGRVGASRGSAAADWLAAVVTGSGGAFALSPTRSTRFAAAPLDHVGGPNTWAPRATVAANDGTSDQRSQVSFLTVTFSQPVDVADPAAFRLTAAGGPPVPLTAYTDLPRNGGVPLAAGASGVERVVLVFVAGAAGTFGFANPDPFGNAVGLLDGNYVLSVDAARVSAGGVLLDGDGDGTAGGDLVAPVYRLFGDVTGDRRVDGADNALFRAAYAGGAAEYQYYFDTDLNGIPLRELDAADLDAFRAARGGDLPPA